MSDAAGEPTLLPTEIDAYYAVGEEHGRLLKGTSRLEFVRTQRIVSRYLPPPPAIVLDVGGGPGRYAVWLAQEGYKVVLIDPSPLHVQQAREMVAREHGPAFEARQGDARQLEEEDESTDAVLLLGPLYHLPERPDRIRALREVSRVLRPNGLVFAAAISRFASLLDGLSLGRLDDDAFAAIVERDLREGQHRNPDARPGWFTTAYFHHPDELAEEVREAGFALEAIIAVEGPGWIPPDLDRRMEDDGLREALLKMIDMVEKEQSMVGMSLHLLAVGRKAGSY